MRILVVSAFFPPENVIAAQRPYVWAREWSEAGHRVTVLTLQKGGAGLAPANHKFQVLAVHPGPVFRWLFRGHQKRKQSIAASKRSTGLISWLISKMKSFGALSSIRLPDVFDLWVGRAIAAVEGEKFDVVVSTFGPPATLRIGNRLRATGVCRLWVADYRDLWAKNPSFRGFPFFRTYERILERRLLSNADMVTTVSEPLARELRKIHHNVMVMPNGFDRSSVVNDGAKWPCSDCGDVIRILYTGSIYWPHQNPTPLFAALRDRMKSGQRNVRVEFCGPGLDRLHNLVGDMGLGDCVHFHGLLPREDVLSLQRRADALLFLESPETPGREGILTGKLFEYLAAAKPILAIGLSATSIVGNIISESEAGASVGTDVEQVLDFLRRLEAKQLPKPKGLPDRFDRSLIAGQMIAAIEKL